MTDTIDAADFGPTMEEVAPIATPEPKRRGRPPGSGTGKRGPRKRNLTNEIGGYLSLLNMAFAFMPDELRGDMLDETEIQALAKALNDYAQQNATVYKYLATVLVQGGSLGTLAITVAIIGGRRLARHGVIPHEMDERLGVFLNMVG